MPTVTTTRAPALGKRNLLSVSVGAAIALLAATDTYAACIPSSTSATVTGSTGCVAWTGGNLTLTNMGVLSSSVNAALSASNAVGTLTNNGVIRGTDVDGLLNTASSLQVVNRNQISGLNGIANNGTISSLLNQSGGTISGTSVGINNSAGKIGSITNQSGGTISGTAAGIFNGSGSTIATLANSGTISGTTYGIQSGNGSSISVLSNASTGVIQGKTGVLFGALSQASSVSVNTLTNAGSISGTTNVGVGLSSNAALDNLSNSGVITGSAGAIGNAGIIAFVNNSGTLSSTGFAVYNAATGTIGSIFNSGLIAGTIGNLSTRALTINGGSGSIFGVLTGASGSIGSANIGLISNTVSNLNFNSGKLLLNDHIDVASNTASNAGATLQINNHISITGNYNQAAAATLLLGVGDSAVSNGVAADTGYGRLIVSQAATIESGSSISLKALNSYGFAAGQRYVVIQAGTTGTDYNEGGLLYSAAGFSGAVTGSTLVEGNTSSLVLTLSGETMQATTPTAQAAFGGLFAYEGTNAELLNLFNASAALDSTAEANRVGAQLNPAWSLGASTSASMNAAFIPHAVIDERLAAEAGSSGIATGESGSRAGFWGQVLGGKATQDRRSDISGYHSDYNGLLFGADFALNDQWRIGGAFSYLDTHVDGKNDNAGSSLKLKSYGLLPYASYTTEDWYLKLSGGVIQHKYDTRRLISFNGVNGVASGDHEGWQSMLSGQVGYPLRLDKQTVLTPIAGLNYMRLKQDGYAESGGAGAALTVASSKGYSLTSDLGAKLEHAIDTSYGRFEPSAQLTWRHEYRDSRQRSVAAFALDPTGSTSFTAIGPAPVRDTGVATLGVTFRQDDNLSFATRYALSAGSGYTAQAAELRVRYEF